MGGFAGKHLVEGGLTAAVARDKWKERFQRDKTWRNTVVSRDDLTSAIGDGKVTGTYPAARAQQRQPMVVTVKGFTVIGRNQNGAKVPGQAIELTQIGVVGSATEGIYFPDHLEGTLSQ